MGWHDGANRPSFDICRVFITVFMIDSICYPVKFNFTKIKLTAILFIPAAKNPIFSASIRHLVQGHVV